MDTIETRIRRAAALRESGQLDEAVRAYRALLALEPALPDCWYNVGWLERRLGRPEAALAAYGEALRFGVRGAEEVHVNCGVILLDDLNRVEEAEREFSAALMLDPDYTPALLNLANLHEDRGARVQAAALYEHILRVDAEHWEALARYANSKSAFGPDDPLMARLELAIARSDLDAASRASLGFALGRAHDLAGQHGAAFKAYVVANRASSESAPAELPRYDPAAHARYVDALISAFPKPATSEPQEDGAPVVFICGMFRSGSTLLEQALGGHPRVTAGGEIPALPALVGELSPFPGSIQAVTPERRRVLAATYRDTVRRLHPAADLLTDKRPDNFLLVGLAKLLFPTAKVLHTVRDPVDTCLSTYFLHLDHALAYARDLDHIAHYFAQYRRLMAHWKTLYPADIHDFDYDRFVRAPRETLEPALQFCDLAWDERCLRFHERESLVRTASVWQVREPLYQRSSGRAQAYAPHVTSLRAALADFYAPAS